MSKKIAALPTTTADIAPPYSYDRPIIIVESERITLGWLPVVSVITTLGVLLLAVAYSAARQTATWAELLFWGSLALIIIPGSLRLLSTETERTERIGTVALLALALYMVKILHSPVAFTFHDEFIHWRTAIDIANNGWLFTPNTQIPVSPMFPGLEIATDCFSQLTGLSLVDAGMIILGISRVFFALAMYLMYEKIGGSTYIAGFAFLIYCANSNYVFFTAQYAYESLALPLMLVVLLTAALRAGSESRHYWSLTCCLVTIAAALTMTHHLTSYFLFGCAALWLIIIFLIRQWNAVAHLGATVLAWYAGESSQTDIWNALVFLRKAMLLRRSKPHEQAMTFGTVLLLAAFVFGWLFTIGSLTVRYLTPVFGGALQEFFQLITGTGQARRLFEGDAGSLAPFWERACGIGATLIVIIGLPIGWRIIWCEHRTRSAALLIAALSALFPVTLLLRFTRAGWETANRASEFLFIGVAFVIALALWRLIKPLRHGRTLVMLSIYLLLFMGGVTTGWSPWARIPGSFLVSADTRSVTLEGIAAAKWTRNVLGIEQYIFSDRVNDLLLTSYGEQHVVSNTDGAVSLAWILDTPTVDKTDRQLIQQRNLAWLMVDRRIASGLPKVGVYFEQGEWNSRSHTTPIPLDYLTKFDLEPGASRVFDSGNIQIYDVRSISPGIIDETP